MSEKYYDMVNMYPKRNYRRNDGKTTRIKHIRLTTEEEANWDSVAIHDFLQGNINSQNAEAIMKLKTYLSKLYEIMNNKMQPDKTLDHDEMQFLEKIEEMIGNGE